MSPDKLSETQSKPDAERRKFRLALTLFILYAVGYALFTLAGTFYKGVLSVRVGGLNLGVVSGMTIIVSAIGIAVAYNWYAGRAEA